VRARYILRAMGGRALRPHRNVTKNKGAGLLSVPRFALRAIGIDRMHQENDGTRHAGSHRNQLNHRTHPSHASQRSIKGASLLRMLCGKMFSARPEDGGTWPPPVTNWQRGLGPAFTPPQKKHPLRVTERASRGGMALEYQPVILAPERSPPV
jgi:hypothetical protein